MKKSCFISFEVKLINQAIYRISIFIITQLKLKNIFQAINKKVKLFSMSLFLIKKLKYK